MSKVRYSLIHNYDRTLTLKQDGTAAVYIRAYLNKKYKFFNTDIYVTPKQWDKRNQRIVHHPNQYQLNKDIREQLTLIERYEYEVRESGNEITLHQLEYYQEKKVVISFTDFYKERLEKGTLKRGSYTDQRQTLKKLKEFRGTIYFHQLNYRLVNEFNSFLINDKGLSINTVGKHHKNLKKYINLAINYDYLDNNRHPYKKFKVKKQPTQRVFLTEQELSLFEKVEIPKGKEHLQLIKDFFLFCCYTGLRVSDANALTMEKLTMAEKGIEVYLVAIKTGKPWHYNLRKFFKSADSETSRPERILEKYVKEHRALFGDSIVYADKPLFKGYTDQYINRELKKLAALAKFRQRLKERLSIHAARHTFGTIMAGKVNVHVLQRFMQHSKLKETMIYVHLNEQMTNSALDDIEW